MTLYVFTKLFEPAPRRLSPNEDIVLMENAKGQMVALRLSPDKVILFGFINEWNLETQRMRKELAAAAAVSANPEAKRVLEDPELTWELLLDPCSLRVDWDWVDEPVATPPLPGQQSVGAASSSGAPPPPQ